MPRKNAEENEAIVVVVDVGKSAVKQNEPAIFFSTVTECLFLILQRKILSESLDHVSLLLLGSGETEGSTVVSGYKNVSCVFDLQLVSWDMLRYVKEKMAPTDNASDWVDGLVIATEMLSLSDMPHKRIVLISEFSHSVSDKKLKDVLKSLKDMEINVAVIGPDHFCDVILDRYGEPSAKRFKGRTEDEKESSTLIKEMWEFLETSLQVCTFDMALRQLTIQPVPSVRKTPWNCILNIGDIEISVTGLLKVKVRSAPAKQRKALDFASIRDSAKDSNTTTGVRVDNNGAAATGVANNYLEEITIGKEMHYATKDPEKGELSTVPVTQDEVIKGHKYGSTIVPFGEADAEAFKFLPGEKGLSVLGFTKMDKFNLGFIIGQEGRIIVPREYDSDSEVALSALVQAMKETNTGAVARRVHAQDKGNVLVLLTPVVESIEDESGNIIHKECLVMSELPYKEGVKHVEFPSLACDLTKEQVQAIDELIDNMDLMTADIGPDGEPCEAFEISTLREFKNQFYQHSLVHRALYPDKPLPTELPPRLKESYSLPQSLKIKNIEVNKKIKNVFPITLIPQKKKSKKRSEDNLNQFVDEAVSVVIVEKEKEQIPEDFPKPAMLEDDDVSVKNVKSLFQEYCLPPVKALIWEIMVSSASSTTKKEVLFNALASCISERRAFCVTVCPKAFNEWLHEMKHYSLDYLEFREYLLRDIAAKFGLITKSENEASDKSLEEAKKFGKEEEAPVVVSSQDFHFPFPDTVEMRLKAEREELLNDIF